MSKQTELAQVADTITVNSGKIGIGTSSPSGAKLQVTGSNYNDQLVIERTDTSSKWSLAGIDSGGFQIYDVNSGNATRMTIDSSGNVGIGTDASAESLGIGTSSPASKMTISSGVNTDTRTFLVDNAHSGGSMYNAFGVYVGDTDRMVTLSADYGDSIMAFRTNNAERMRIDSAGRVTTPSQPSFRARTFIPISSSTGVIVWQTAAHNVGGHYNTSNGTFTAPVNGTYHFAGNILMDAGSSTHYIRVLFRINGVSSTNFTDSLTGGNPGAFTDYNYHTVQIAQSFYLYAGDTVQMWNDNPNGSTYNTSGYGSFSGFLVG